MKCTICSHPNKHEIEQAILTGQAQTRIALNYGVGVDAVRYHSQHHLSQRMVKAFKTKEALTDLNMATEFSTLIADIKEQITKLKKKGADGLTIAATNTLIKLYGVMCQFAAVYYQQQSNENQESNEAHEAKEIEITKEQLSMLTLAELKFLQRIAEKINSGNNKTVIFSDIDYFEQPILNDLPKNVDLYVSREEVFKTPKNAMKRKYTSKDESLQVYPLEPEVISRQNRTLNR